MISELIDGIQNGPDVSKVMIMRVWYLLDYAPILPGDTTRRIVLMPGETGCTDAHVKKVSSGWLGRTARQDDYSTFHSKSTFIPDPEHKLQRVIDPYILGQVMEYPGVRG